jgi:hypothetical protein
MQPHGLADLVPDREDGVQRCHRLLENHRDLSAAHLPHLPLRPPQEIFAAIPDLTRHDATGGTHQSQNGKRRDALATSGFAEDAERAPRVYGETHAIDGPPYPLLRLEVRVQVTHVEQRRPALRHPPAPTLRGSSVSRR